MLAIGAIALQDKQVSVNPYTINFKPINSGNFKHLVCFQIKGSHGQYGFLDPIFERVGNVMRHYLCLGTEHHKILVLVETTLK